MAAAPTLENLIAPIGRDAFFRKYWPDEFVHLRCGPRLVEAFDAIPAIRSVSALAKVAKSPVRVFSHTQDRLDVAVSADAAEGFYEHGHTLLFGGLHRDIPELDEILKNLAQTFGVDRDRFVCDAFASRGSASVDYHFDPNYQFNVQLRGTKRWHVARNAQIQYPPNGYHVAFDIPNPLRDLGFRPPAAFPAEHHSFIAKPGSVIWLPWGWWHKTAISSDDDSFCLIFGFRPVTWATHVSLALERRLLRDVEWRKPVFGLRNDDRFGPRVRREVSSFLAKLREDVLSLSEEDLSAGDLPAYLGPGHLFRARASQVSVRRRSRAPRRYIATFRGPGRSRLSLELDTEPLVRLVRWAADQKKGFSGAQAAVVASPLPPFKVANALRALVGASVLERVART